MIEQNIVQNKDEWKDVFLLFKQNSYFFSRASSDYLTRILEFLTTYSRIVNTKQSLKIGFHEFYVTYLNDITNLDVDGIQVCGDRLDAYIFQQLKEQFANYLDELLYVTDDTLRTYNDNREHKKCVQISTVIFQNIASQASIVKKIKENESIRESIYHTMIAATRCGQSCYVANNMESNPFGGDIKSAKRYLTNNQNGKNYIDSFIKLFEVLEAEGLMPRRGRQQVRELEKYYNVYTSSDEE